MTDLFFGLKTVSRVAMFTELTKVLCLNCWMYHIKYLFMNFVNVFVAQEIVGKV